MKRRPRHSLALTLAVSAIMALWLMQWARSLLLIGGQ
jgi:hypothetical protein